MPKRSLDVANMGGPNTKPAPARKVKALISYSPCSGRIIPTNTFSQTERSHEENQERAYIAASRRADRSIEARVQSAKMASEIHKKRTGKAFRITEEIVMKEEMYEEEDDDFPRSYRLLKSNMQTDNAILNARVDAYLTNRVAMSQLLSATEADWRNNEINSTFAQFFPQAQRQAQSMSHRWSTPGYSAPQTQNNHATSPMEQQPFDPNFQPVNYGQQINRHDERNHSIAGLSPAESRSDAAMSPTVFTPTSASHPDTPRSRCTSIFGNPQPSNMMENFNPGDSAFTSELPAEAKMLMGGMDLSGSFNTPYHGEWTPHQTFSYDTDTKFFKEKEDENNQLPGGETYPDVPDTMNWGNGDFNTPTKNYAEEPSWDSFIDDNAWVNSEPQ